MSLRCSCRVEACSPDDAEIWVFGSLVPAHVERSDCPIHGREEGPLMSDNDLCELIGRLKHADYELQKAVEEAIRLMGCNLTEGEPIRLAIADLVDRLEAMRDALAKLPDERIREATKHTVEHVNSKDDGLLQTMRDAQKAQRAIDSRGTKPKEWQF